ncbi:methylmalonyl-CoA mutase family protein [Belliella sp. DSM 107340]|uniref:Methylmalonyl-CoA mutase family protein n=1 Tax=Belliella calami TaxID=2923436 RepID=A0ABS9UM04_9BACT|nr:methylmalonyl-CoA mutase family protein [Belliella calami]MCH7397641.1 methylmalonyl-CoA mutase family protein [Belliella calami]
MQNNPNVIIDMRNKLLDDFVPTTKEEWIAQVVKDLKGKDFEDTLVNQTLDRFRIQPFYTIEDLPADTVLSEFHHRLNLKPSVPGIAPRVWSNVVRIAHIDEKAGNEILLESLQNGADAIVLELDGNEDLSVLLKGIQPAYINLFLEPTDDPIPVFSKFKDWLSAESHDFSDINGGIIWDGAVQNLTKRRDRKNISQTCKTLLSMGKELSSFRTLTLQCSHYHNSGSSIVQELAFSLSYFIDLVEELSAEGISPREIFGNLILQTAVGSDYFLEMTKIKVLRILIQNLASLYQVEQSPEDIFIYVQTSFWTKSGVDVQTNLLRNTTEAMSAILGGCNALEVLRHDVVSKEMGEFSLRMSRNVSNILKEESYLDQVLDPVAGSYFMESLIAEIFENAKEKLLEIEQIGGWWQAADQNIIQNEVKSVREKQQQMVLEGSLIKVGVNKYLSDIIEDLQLEDPIANESESQLKFNRQSFLKEVLNQEKL